MLKKIQAGSGLLFFAFVALHLINTWLATFGAGAYDSVQVLLRGIYQFAPVEALILSALSLHVVVGVVRIAKEPKRDLTSRAKWHRYAGFFLAIVIVGHILAVRGSSWFFDVYPGFSGLAFSIDYLPLYFLPYYFLLGTAGFYHGVNGVIIAMHRFGFGMGLSRISLPIATAVASVLMVTTLLSMAGVFTDLGDVTDNNFARLALELVGDSP